jgi:hypothetical protein
MASTSPFVMSSLRLRYFFSITPGRVRANKTIVDPAKMANVSAIGFHLLIDRFLFPGEKNSDIETPNAAANFPVTSATRAQIHRP